MRLIILNPHVNYCGKMVFNALFRFPHHHKYTFLWKEYLKDDKVSFLIDGKQSSFYQAAHFRKTIARIPTLLWLFTVLEFFIWMVINHVSFFKCKVHFGIKKLDPQKDVIFSFGFTIHTSNLDKYNGIVLVHMTHYHHDTEKIAKFIKGLKHGFAVAESNIVYNDYYMGYFGEGKDIYQLPFAINSDRFKKTKEFNKRINKCFASGSMSTPSSSAYVNYYGKGVALNSMRESIYKNKDNLGEVIDAYIYPHNEALRELKEIKKNDNVLIRIGKKRLPFWILKILFNYELPYFRFDIVQKYNEYTMFMSPEENTGLPSMKLLEGILCGAVLIGIDDPMYTNIGFKDGVNFISYKNNDLDGLTEKIKYYQSHVEDLEKIAYNGYEFVISNFTPKKVADIFWYDIEKLLNTFNNGEAIFKSSFVVK